MLTKLSVNLNKIALIRNSRDGNTPSVTLFGAVALKAGAAGLTVHPRPDERHIRRDDVPALAKLLRNWPGREFNIEGNPFMNLMEHVREVRPDQVTFVPDSESQKTSDHGFNLMEQGEKLRPLIAESRRRVERGEAPLFNSHMLDASTLPMAENLKLSRELLKECAELGIVLEIEIGVVGGEEDGVDNSGHPADKLYTSPEDMLMTYEALAPLGKFMLAATFGNVHGVYKPGHVKLKPSILRDGQEAVVAKHGEAARMPLVFHGGSGSELSDIREAVSYGVVKMNIDTDTQYAFTRPIVSHMCEHINGVLKIDGEVGNKKDYDPRSYLAKGEKGVAARLQEAADNLMSAGKTLFGKI